MTPFLKMHMATDYLLYFAYVINIHVIFRPLINKARKKYTRIWLMINF